MFKNVLIVFELFNIRSQFSKLSKCMIIFLIFILFYNILNKQFMILKTFDFMDKHKMYVTF